MDEKTCKMSVLLLAEGTVRIYKNKPFVTFTNTSDVLENLFKKLAKEMHYKVYKKSLKQWSIYSKPLAKRLLKECKSFRSKPCSSGLQNACPVVSGKLKTGASCYMCKPKTHNGKQYSPSTFPDSVLNSNNDKTAEYLRIYFTCDGGVVVGKDKRNDEVIVRVGHPNLRKQVLRMIAKLGIKARLRGESLIFIKKRSEVLKFKTKIGFIPDAKSVRGLHKGIEKNKLLDIIIERHGSV